MYGTMGDRIKELRKASGLTQTDLGKMLGVQAAAIGKYEHGRVQNLKRETIQKMADIFGVKPSYILGLEDSQGELDLYSLENVFTSPVRAVPIIGEICAGKGVFMEENYNGVVILDRRCPGDALMEVRGDSMKDADIHNGDLVMLRKEFEFEEGNIYAVLIEGENLLSLKRVYKKKNALLLLPCNPNFEPMIVGAEEARVVGECVGLYRRLKE